jgi:hypothetical protein
MLTTVIKSQQEDTMGEYLDQIPENIRPHIREITRSSGLPEGDESVERIAQGWLEKKSHFEEQIGKFNMEELQRIEDDDQRGFLVMTYSGSLLTIGPIVEDTRNAEYTSIGLRSDVPESASNEESRLDGAVEVDEVATFAVGPIKASSPIFKIAVFSEQMDVDQQEEQLSTATQILTEEFVDVNKTLMLD